MIIVIMGILLSIATSSWFGLVDSRRVTSDTNQFASDLRLAHTKSTNQLKDYAVVTDLTDLGLSAGTADYYIVEITGSVVTPRQLDDSGRTEIDTAFGVTFEPDGSATNVAGLTTTISLDDGGVANNPKHEIDVNSATSRVKID
jgi:type II secretory pathway pseudopilin PulG